MTDRIRKALGGLKARQDAGEHMPCPRCGRDTMKACQRCGTRGGKVNVALSVHDLRGDGGLPEQFFVIRVGGNQSALDGAFQQRDDDQTVYGRQVAAEESRSVARPEADAENSDKHRQ